MDNKLLKKYVLVPFTTITVDTKNCNAMASFKARIRNPKSPDTQHCATLQYTVMSLKH
jgi:hypothetical protein